MSHRTDLEVLVELIDENLADADGVLLRGGDATGSPGSRRGSCPGRTTPRRVSGPSDPTVGTPAERCSHR